MPTRPELAVREVLVHKVRGYTSAEAPVSLVCNCRPLTDSEGGAVPAMVLYKLDDLRQDQIYMNIIRLMWRILQGDTAFMQKLSGMVGDDFDIITYDVLPLSSRDGLLQWVDSAAFADVVKETQSKPEWKNCAILHYLVQTASQGDDIAATKKCLEASINRFVVSTAIYTAISYLLGVKDRHMDNFKVTPQGDMFHIDYGWVMDRAPQVMEQGEMRYCQQFSDVMNSELRNAKTLLGHLECLEEEDCLDLCADCFAVLRPHAPLFADMLRYLVEEGVLGGDNLPYSHGDVARVLADRFMIGSSQKSAVEQFKLRLDQCKQFSWGIWARDLAHEKKPEIVDGMRKLVDTVLETPAWLNSFTAMR
mmetsp:Transcript_55050/g.119906  ORF Transcript_55050/g.119906 Transcript_55050/m.119906 type:complete len:363 (+) Transcript_55050:325-1413(+)